MNDNLWSYEQHKRQEKHFINRAKQERLAHSVIAASPSSDSPNSVVVWVGERLIELGSRLTAQPMRDETADYQFAETAS